MWENMLHINKGFVSYMGFNYKSACNYTCTKFEMPLITPSLSQYCFYGCWFVRPVQGCNITSGMIDYEWYQILDYE